MTHKIHLDFETFSKIKLPDVGHFRYAEHYSTKALIASYSLGPKEPVIGVDLSKATYKKEMEPFFNAVANGATICAHNSQFERAIWEQRCGFFPITPKSWQWSCTSARSSAMALPATLEAAGVALKLDTIKDPLGKQLINRFSMPQKDGTVIRQEDDPAAFNKFIEYCKQDTVVERHLDAVLPELSEYESKVFQLDYKINGIGVPIDIPLVHTALAFIDEVSANLEKRAMSITGVKTSQRDKLLEWLQDKGSSMETLQAAEVERAIADPETPKALREILETRIECSRAGTKKLKTMLTCVSPDGRVRGAFWYNSASTGRWGSSRVQFHNFQKPDPDYPQEDIISLLEQKALDLFYDRPLTAIAKSIRGFIKAPEGKEFAVADYSAIEARGLAWLANETWLLDAFKAGKDVYKITAARIYHIREDEVTEAQRFFGKQTVLGAGYGMGIVKFIATCAKFKVIITEKEAKEAIEGYRASVPAIAGKQDENGYWKGGLWRTVERACIQAVLTGKQQVICEGKLTIYMDKLSNGFEVLYIVLPSGRKLAYPEMHVEQVEKWGKLRPVLVFKSFHRFMLVDEETYGGKLVENIVQALTRDILADGLLAVDNAGLSTVAHIHDEIIAEVDQGTTDLAAFEKLVCKTRKWSKGLPITAGAKKVIRYSK